MISKLTGRDEIDAGLLPYTFPYTVPSDKRFYERPWEWLYDNTWEWLYGNKISQPTIVPPLTSEKLAWCVSLTELPSYLVWGVEDIRKPIGTVDHTKLIGAFEEQRTPIGDKGYWGMGSG